MSAVTLSLLFLPLLILLVYLLIRRSATSQHIWTYRRLIWLGGGYLFVLAAATLLYFLLPIDQLPDEKRMDPAQALKRAEQFYAALGEGRLDVLDAELAKEWFFQAEGEELGIRYAGEYAGPELIIGSGKQPEGKIEVRYYQTPVVVNGMEISKLIPAPEVRLKGRQLTIYPPEDPEVRLAQLSNEFTIRQFSRKRPVWGGEEMGAGALYIGLPEEMVVHVDEEISVWWLDR